MRKIIIEYGAVALSPTKKTNRSLPKGIERFAAFVYNKIAKHHQQESEDIYEIKHSTGVVEKQYQHLIDEEKCKATEWRYGSITGKYVIYRGESCDVNGIHYLNVEEYLKNIT